ncbi:MAG: 50S ribosomal protein L30 [Deltaproteobacteria bacterium]|nr:50S ribosomal protein L30 [Deltaproteobacteria bacterium]
MASLIRVTLKRSTGKCIDRQRATLLGLGLKRRGDTKVLKDTVPVRGMVMKMQHMLDVERFDGDDAQRDSARLRAARAS